MSRNSARKISTLALLTSAVFAISTLAPVNVLPAPFSPDFALAKSSKGKGGGKDSGKGAEIKAAKAGKGAGTDKAGKGVGGAVGKAADKVDDLLSRAFGRDKARKTVVDESMEAKHAPMPKTKPKDLMAMGIHPSQLKGGWMGVLMANPNGNFNSSANSVHGRARAWMEATDEEQAKELFEAVTKGKTPYDEELAEIIEKILSEKDDRWRDLADEAAAESEAAPAETAEETMSLRTPDDETVPLTVE